MSPLDQKLLDGIAANPEWHKLEVESSAEYHLRITGIVRELLDRLEASMTPSYLKRMPTINDDNVDEWREEAIRAGLIRETDAQRSTAQVAHELAESGEPPPW